MSLLPDVIFVGPERTGTTWIHRYLASRGDVRLPARTKETFFFDRYFEQGLPWYLSHFDSPAGELLTVEVAPTYFHSERAGQRIHAAQPQARIVCTLRHPIQRSYSHFQHMRAYGGCGDSLREAVAQHPQIVDASRYARHLSRLQAEFGSERVHVLLFDDLESDSEQFARRLCTLLELPFMPPSDDIRSERVNAGGQPRHPRLARIGFWIRGPLRRARLFGLIALAKRLGIHRLFFGVSARNKAAMSEGDLAYLRAAVEPEIVALEQLLGRELPTWRSSGD